jgi:CRP/FNR family transcriptional regulator
VEPSQVVLIQKKGFIDLLGRKPELAVRMLAIMSMRLRMLLMQMEDLTVKDVDCRLAGWLLRRCPDAADTEPHAVHLTFSKKVLAAELGTVSETLSRTLGHLRDEGLVKVEGRSITVLSPAGLGNFLKGRVGG